MIRKAWMLASACVLTSLSGLSACSADDPDASANGSGGNGASGGQPEQSGGTAGTGATPAEGGTGERPSAACSTAEVSAIFQAGCATGLCHQLEAPDMLPRMSELDLFEPGFEDRLLDQPAPDCDGKLLIDSENVEQSYLLEKLEKSEPTCGDPMPVGSELTEDEKTCVRSWVEALVENQ